VVTWLLLVACGGLLLHGILETLWNCLRAPDARVVPPEDVPAIAPDDLPRVTIQLPVYNEFYVVDRLIDGCCALDYPRDRLQIQVLDDSTDDTTARIARKVAAYAAQGLDIAHLRRGDRAGFKAGNLQHGLASATGEFLAIFDADFVPDRDFLLRTLPYLRHPAVGVVYPRNPRNLNRETSTLTRAQDPRSHRRPPAGYKVHFGRCFNFFFGSPGVIRKACLDDIGGWQGDTLCEDEDFTIRSYLRGWRCVALDEPMTQAELPETMEAVKQQYVRWKKGNAECYRKHFVNLATSGTLTARQKAAAIAALHVPFLYIPSTAVMALASVPLLATAGDGLLDRLALAIPSLLAIGWLGGIALAGDRKQVLTLLLHLGLYPRITWGIVQGFLRVRTPFVRSTKLNSTAARGRERLYAVTLTPSIAVEAGLALYFLSGLYLAVQTDRIWLAPFHLLCVAAFSFVFVLSVLDVWPASVAMVDSQPTADC
jgi:cellulose synthase/poly-beta-1,6-N-acetylglucosamine synthase-like glycosyltransferase